MPPPLPWQELARRLAGAVEPVGSVEHVSALSVAGRILAADVMAARQIPAFSHAVMDGYALGSPPPGRYRLLAKVPALLAPSEASVIAAGGHVPDGCTTVVLADKAEVAGQNLHVPGAQAKDNIRHAGEETAAGAPLLRAGCRLDARHGALALAAGINTLPVFRRPRVALLGVFDGEESLPHLTVLAALLATPSLHLTQAGCARSAALADALARLAPGHDLIIVTADSLGGEDGVLAAAVSTAGGSVRAHRAALKPAKPVLSGTVGAATILGFSGTAYAAAGAAHLFLRPVLRRILGLSADDPFLPAVADFARAREPGRSEMLPAHLHRTEAGLTVTLAGRFGQLGALAAMDGFALIDAGSGPVRPGSALAYLPLAMPLV